MRDNTAALKALSYFHIEQGKGRPWGVITTPSVSTFMGLVKDHAQTPNERAWGDNSVWIGLGSQTRAELMETGVAKSALDLAKSTVAKLPAKYSAFSKPVGAVTGGFWDVPAVIANIPMAARTRQRQKLAPINLRFACFWSAGISQESLAPYLAKLVRAIYDYTMAGGAVSLKIGFISNGTDEQNRYNQICVETKVNCADLSALATVFSPVGFRALGGRLLSALCDSRGNPTQGFNTDGTLPGAIFLNGCLEDVFKALDAALLQLEITHG